MHIQCVYIAAKSKIISTECGTNRSDDDRTKREQQVIMGVINQRNINTISSLSRDF